MDQRIDSQTLKGHLEGVLLRELESAGPAHGYAIVQQIRTRSEGTFDLPEGTVYPALHRLEKARLVKSHSEEVSGRRRRVYEITREGERRLTAKKAEWRRLRHGMDAVLEGAP